VCVGAFQVISIFGQPENCTNACKEILQVMQQESTNNNRGFVVVVTWFYCAILLCTVFGFVSESCRQRQI